MYNRFTRLRLLIRQGFPIVVGLLALAGTTSVALGRDPPPSPADRATSLALIKTLFKIEYAKTAPADRVALARRLLEEARQTRDDRTARYVLLDQATDLARNAGATLLALQAIDLQAQETLLDPLPAKVLILQRTQVSAGVGNTADQEVIVRTCLPLVEETLAADDFAHGRELLAVAQAAAGAAQKVDLAPQVARQVADFQNLAAEFTQVQIAQEKLKTTPDDPALNLTLGKYYGLSKGQWDYALNYLAKGTDPVLKNLAEKELSTPGHPAKPDGLAQLQIADAWWELGTGESFQGRAKANVLAHARLWYQAASTSISGLTLTRIQERIKTLAPATTRPGATRSAENIVGAAEPVLDLLTLVDLTRDLGSGSEPPGDWQRREGKLLCGKARHARIQLPYVPPEEYDLQVCFSRLVGDGPVVVLLTGLGQTFGLSLDAQGHVARFEAIDKKLKKDNPTVVPCTLATERAYTLTVQVRKDKVTALLDGKKLCEFNGESKQLSRGSGWKMPEAKTLGVGAGNSEVLFGPIRVVEITGKGHQTRVE